MELTKPYFLKNKNWFYYDEEEMKYKLKKDAPAEAIKSYNDYYRQIDAQYEVEEQINISGNKKVEKVKEKMNGKIK